MARDGIAIILITVTEIKRQFSRCRKIRNDRRFLSCRWPRANGDSASSTALSIRRELAPSQSIRAIQAVKILRGFLRVGCGAEDGALVVL